MCVSDHALVLHSWCPVPSLRPTALPRAAARLRSVKQFFQRWLACCTLRNRVLEDGRVCSQGRAMRFQGCWAVPLRIRNFLWGDKESFPISAKEVWELLALIHWSAALRKTPSWCLSVLLNRGELIARNFKGTFYSLNLPSNETCWQKWRE